MRELICMALSWEFSVWGGTAPEEQHGLPASLYFEELDEYGEATETIEVADFDTVEFGGLDRDEQLAVARLIVKAPDLYKRLRAITEAAEGDMTYPEDIATVELDAEEVWELRALLCDIDGVERSPIPGHADEDEDEEEVDDDVE